MKTMLAILFLFAVSDAHAECCQCQCVTPNSPIDPPAVVTPVPPPVAPPVVNNDPGSGSWSPMPGRLIADQSGPNASYLSSYVPGCLNGDYITSSWNTGCGANASFGGFAFGSGRTLGLRYISKPGAGTKVKYFTFASADGGGTGSLKVWLSPSPTASYEATSAACKSTSTRQPYIATGPGYCTIIADGRYYLFMSTDRADTNLRYLVNENASDFY